MISIHAATQADLETLAHITKTAYNSVALDLTGLAQRLRIQPDGFFLAHLNDNPVGMVCVFDYHTFASIGTLGVLPEARGQGVARQLMEQAEAWANARNISSFMLDATPEGATLYEKMNYIDVDTNYRMTANLSGPTYKQHKTIHLATSEDLDALLEFDTPIFGANRKKVLEVFLQDFPERTFLSKNRQGNLTGFLLAQSSTLGPWLAISPQSAERLLNAALALPFEKPPRVLLPATNKEGLELLLQHGFTVLQTLQHMVKGEVPKRQRQLIYSQASYSLG
jgi:ribosomal protein S18 acetylase RimI-like enzyme